MFLSHLDQLHYYAAVKESTEILLPANTENLVYQVLTIADTIDQMQPAPQCSSKSRPTTSGQMRILEDYINGNAIPDDEYSTAIDSTSESPYIRSFCIGGGGLPFSRGGGRGEQRKYNNNSHKPYQNKTASFKGKCNGCGMQNHHADSRHFLLKLRQVINYLSVEHQAGFKKHTNFIGHNTHTENRSYVMYL